jgi:hypothetical protein
MIQFVDNYDDLSTHASLSGSQVTFSYISGNVKGKDSCKTMGFDKPAQINKTTYRVEHDGKQMRLCQVGTELTGCLYKE